MEKVIDCNWFIVYYLKVKENGITDYVKRGNEWFQDMFLEGGEEVLIKDIDKISKLELLLKDAVMSRISNKI